MTFFLSTAVRVNSGPEVERKAREGLVNMRTFHMEYDICSVSVFLFLKFIGAHGLYDV